MPEMLRLSSSFMQDTYHEPLKGKIKWFSFIIRYAAFGVTTDRYFEKATLVTALFLQPINKLTQAGKWLPDTCKKSLPPS